MSQTPAHVSSYSDVKGWFGPVDQLLFDWFLTGQRDAGIRGDLLELGAYLGKSAIFTGYYRAEGESFTVCDLFDSPAPDASNGAEMERSYATLTRRAFETNYLSFHDTLPTVVQAPTSLITGHVRPGSCRFVHVDASHLYEHVHGDVESARLLLAADGIVAFDDYRAEHCPGVAAAVWGAVASGGLRPVCLTGTKLYGTWGDPAPLQEALLRRLESRTDVWHGVEDVAGAPLIRLKPRGTRRPWTPRSRYPAAPAADPLPAPAAAPADASGAAGSAPAARRRAPALRRLARDLLPPILTRALTHRS
ncbi:class I SAM-dependent methyltransferase [Streptomyces sp. SP18CS02]|uniref:class I SAM-dependent methyltransferase n=1 Tax=Streptomyces sp. SP18CS02 TaxID=3002531 RepID=UPI002E776135|nr:class I SAM-dependent methyltransferase [Streptomyces sp. SP18CS02]MEE1756770.1 class I SAM-dependent methyltransferase [Streptomyces sp. SP18CS02]